MICVWCGKRRPESEGKFCCDRYETAIETIRQGAQSSDDRQFNPSYGSRLAAGFNMLSDNYEG